MTATSSLTRATGILWRVVTALTRRLQRFQPHRSLRGLGRLSRLLHRILPPYTTVVRMNSGVRLNINTAESFERWFLVSGAYHPALTEHLRRHVPRGGCCIDVGANLGFFTTHLADWVGSDGRVAAFEPNPAMAERIRDNLRVNRFTHVDVIEQAVHDQAGPITFYVAADPAMSSMNETLTKQVVKTITVEATTLDAYVASAGWSRLDAIKIDVEGNDCRVLLGSQQTLRRFRPFIVFEYKYSLRDDAAARVFDLFAELDYQLDGLTPTGDRIAFDWQHAPAGLKEIDVLCTPRDP